MWGEKAGGKEERKDLLPSQGEKVAWESSSDLPRVALMPFSSPFLIPLSPPLLRLALLSLPAKPARSEHELFSHDNNNIWVKGEQGAYTTFSSCPAPLGFNNSSQLMRVRWKGRKREEFSAGHFSSLGTYMEIPEEYYIL